MSSNNIVYIIEQDDGTFKSFDWDVESDVWPSEQYTPDFAAETLRGAIAQAEEYVSDNIVEYGYQVVLKKSDNDHR